jgi:prepilin-type N-terminal cleavage/methylation domain-containing protein
MKNLKGFTLAEVLVAVGILSLIIATMAGIFVSFFRYQNYSWQAIQVLNEISYVMEYISRALRMAKKDDLGGKNCLAEEKVNYELTHNGFGIKFRNYKNQCQEFYLDGGKIKEWKEGETADLTSDNLEIVAFKIDSLTADSWDQEDLEQPRVVFIIEAKPKKRDFPKLKIQTTISQRNLDFKR